MTTKRPGRPKLSPRVRSIRVAASRGFIAAAMMRLGLTAEALANRLGVHEKTVRNWARGRTIMSTVARRAVESLR